MSSYGTFVGACLLNETPRGIGHCLLCLLTTYAIHDLNPNPTNVTFCVLCLMVAVVAWQGVICFCAAATKHIAATHLLIFLQLGGGTLFGGLLIAVVRKEKKKTKKEEEEEKKKCHLSTNERTTTTSNRIFIKLTNRIEL